MPISKQGREQPYICTEDSPWTPDKGTPTEHHDAVCVYDGGWDQEYERYECPHCDLRFTVTLPSG